MLRVVSPNAPRWVAFGIGAKAQVFDHLERQIVFLLIGGVDFILSRGEVLPVSCGGDLSIKIVTPVAAHDFYAGRTFTACGPFCPCWESYSTWSPSFRDLKPLA